MEKQKNICKRKSTTGEKGAVVQSESVFCTYSPSVSFFIWLLLFFIC